MGQQCTAIRDKFPHLVGRIILEDLPAVVSRAKVPAGVEVLQHNFWYPQPIKGAKFYYLRAVLHDYNDMDSCKILKHIADAMGPESVLLIDEMVLPNKGVDWYATQTDLLMMCVFGSAERTQDAWARLMEQVGLEVRSLQTYTYAMRLSIIEVVKQKGLNSRI
jgi:demethylsterigmatocystin 6-O-methyltransferase